MAQFTHLHVHSHYSILDGMAKVPDLVEKCLDNGMQAMALTDHGVMYGIKEFTDYVSKNNKKHKGVIKDNEKVLADESSTPEQRAEAEAAIAKAKSRLFKPIFGVEAYCARRKLTDKDKDVKMINPESGREQIIDRSGYHLVLLAKNKTGYKNLCKLVSISWIDGYYGRPRIDKEVLEKYSEGLVVCSACLGGELPQLIIAGKHDEAEKSVLWFKKIFGDDFYIELQRHKTDKPNADFSTYERQKMVIPHLIELAKKTDTKIIATNDVHFVEEHHGESHDMLICLSTGKKVSEDHMRYTRQEWLKTPAEMEAIFQDFPEALSNTIEITDKIEEYSIDSGPLMPKFDIPEEFGTEEEYRKKFTDEDIFNEFTRDENGNVVLKQEEAEDKIKKLGGYDKLYRIKLEADYLAKLAWEGAHKRYGDTLTDEQTERIVFELHIMKTMGFPGYFLIVQDYIRAAREELGVSVGPGRGSAAGSVVAYCLWITDVDPLKYDLLFERFLNPDRISLPDIDVDFDDDGRGDVLRWVTNKYGKEKVAHIITYGTMATKSSIKDVGRVLDIPLSEVNQIVNLIPDKFPESMADPKTKKVPKVNIKNCVKLVKELNLIRYEGDNESHSSMLEHAEELENTIRQTGVHACGVIIGADDLTKFAPLGVISDKVSGEDVLVTQYDGHYVESVGLIKMDFLGLKTLSIIKEAIKNIKKRHDIEIDIDKIPIDDKKTYELYCQGRTIGTFQFESPGMQKYLRELQPSVFEDLIAMNALYRPGPMDYIPDFIDRKLGRKPITYDIDIMEKYLKDTYGITVYQEQVMLLSRLLANFTRGQSDALRKAMGKKLIAVLNELKGKFMDGGTANGHDPKILEKIWADWEKFASYAFNKSHATCYSWVAYQTAYLKAHYPAEFMAANLTRSKDNITDVEKFMIECKAMGVSVKGPNVNESELNFTVNQSGEILFGLGGVKGVGDGAVEAIINERSKNGPYKNIYDFVERVNLSACNKKAVESLALAGAFDSLDDIYREQIVAVNAKGEVVLDTLIRYGNKVQADMQSAANSLFGFDDVAIKKPDIPKVEKWPALDRLNKERDLVGIYLSAHPLDEFSVILDYVCNTKMSDLSNPDVANTLKNKSLTLGGMVTNMRTGKTKKGNDFGILTVEDFSGSHEFAFFGQDYIKFANFFNYGLYLFINASYQEKQWAKNGEYEVKVNTIELLTEVKDSLIEKLTITIKDSSIDSIFTNDFISLAKRTPAVEDYVDSDGRAKQKRRVSLYFRIIDSSTGRHVDLHSRNTNIHIDKELIDYLKEQSNKEVFAFKFN